MKKTQVALAVWQLIEGSGYACFGGGFRVIGSDGGGK